MRKVTTTPTAPRGVGETGFRARTPPRRVSSLLGEGGKKKNKKKNILRPADDAIVVANGAIWTYV